MQPGETVRARALPSIRFTEERLDNGLRVVLAPDAIAPVVATNLWYDVGSKHEVPGRTGFAHLFEHMMFQGSRNVAKGEHFRLIQRAGGGLNASTWFHRTNYFEHGPANQLELYLWLEADRMGGFLDALGQETLDNQRDVVKNEKRQRYDNQPYGSWWIRMVESLFPPGHPYHHPTIGSMEDLDAVTVEDCRSFFSAYYAPNNAVLSITGAFDPGQARAWVRQYFGGIPAYPSIPPAPDPALDLALGGEVRHDLHERVPLPRIFVGYRAPAVGTPESDAVEMAAALLALNGPAGPSRGTRLYRTLVRERQLAQDVDVITQPLTGVGIAVVTATARAGVDVSVLEEAVHEVVATLADGVPDEELERARASVQRTAVEGWFLRAASRADALSEHATVYGDPDELNRRLPALLEVTGERIQDIVRRVFRPENRVVLTFHPEAS